MPYFWERINKVGWALIICSCCFLQIGFAHIIVLLWVWLRTKWVTELYLFTFHCLLQNDRKGWIDASPFLKLGRKMKNLNCDKVVSFIFGVSLNICQCWYIEISANENVCSLVKMNDQTPKINVHRLHGRFILIFMKKIHTNSWLVITCFFTFRKKYDKWNHKINK